MEVSEGLDRLRLSARFMTTSAQQLNTLELVLRANIDEIERNEDRLFLEEYATMDEVKSYQRDERMSMVASGTGAGGAGGAGGSGARQAHHPQTQVVKTSSSLAALSGAGGLQYLEYTSLDGKGGHELLRSAEREEATERMARKSAAVMQARELGLGAVAKRPPPA